MSHLYNISSTKYGYLYRFNYLSVCVRIKIKKIHVNDSRNGDIPTRTYLGRKKRKILKITICVCPYKKVPCSHVVGHRKGDIGKN